MSTEQNKALANRLVNEVFNQRNLGLMDDLLSPNFVEHEQLPPGIPDGPEAPKAMFNMLFSAFPDFQTTVEHMVAEGDLVVLHMTWTGTQQGEFMGIPPTGKSMSMKVIDILRIVDGKFLEHWGVTDMMTMMQQLGVMPE